MIRGQIAITALLSTNAIKQAMVVDSRVLSVPVAFINDRKNN